MPRCVKKRKLKKDKCTRINKSLAFIHACYSIVPYFIMNRCILFNCHSYYYVNVWILSLFKKCMSKMNSTSDNMFSNYKTEKFI